MDNVQSTENQTLKGMENCVNAEYGFLENVLHEKKKYFDKLMVPEEFEQRLRSSLTVRRKKNVNRIFLVAAILGVLFLTYNMDVLAYYGIKFMGYDDVSFGKIKEFNDKGYGQEIGKSYQFSDGVVFTIDGILLDDNKLVMFYQVKDPNKVKDSMDFSLELKGISPFGYIQRSSAGDIKDEKAMKFVGEFESPQFFEKNLDLVIRRTGNNQIQEGKINFWMDRSRAIKRVVKRNIGKSITIEDVKINFKDFNASPMSITINGTIDELSQHAVQWFKSRIPGQSSPTVVFDVVVDGKKMTGTSGGGGRGIWGLHFEDRFDGISEAPKKIEIKNIGLSSRKMLDRKKEISYTTENLEIDPDVTIKKVYTEGDLTCLDIQSAGEINDMGLMIDGNEAKLQDTPESDENKAVSHIKTFKFKGVGKKLEVLFKGITYTKYSDETIPIPVDK